MHEELLQSYLAGWQGLAEVLDDGYFMQNVGHHLATAKRFRDLKTLLTNAAWLEGKLHSYGVASVVADYRRCESNAVIKALDQNLQAQHPCCQCSLRSWAKTFVSPATLWSCLCWHCTFYL